MLLWYGMVVLQFLIIFTFLVCGVGRVSLLTSYRSLDRVCIRWLVNASSPIMATLYYTVQPVLSKPKTVVVVVLKVPWETNIHKGHNLKFNEYCNLRTNQVKSKFICCLRSCEKYNLCIVYQNISAYLKLLLIHFYNVFQKLH